MNDDCLKKYQYYEFLALDRLLTGKEMSELRNYSSRARINPSGFINSDSWGNFKGNEDRWMEQYFDAFLYLANWGSRTLKFRIPGRLLDPASLAPYGEPGSFSFHEKDGRFILTFSANDETSSDWVEGDGILPSLVPVRSAIMEGDLRPFYLAWLLGIQDGQLEEDGDGDENGDEDEEWDDPEDETCPAVPAGLRELDESLKAFADFLRIDPALIAAAAEDSPPLASREPDLAAIQSWIAKLPVTEKDGLLAECLLENGVAAVQALRQRFRREAGCAPPAGVGQMKTVGELLRRARSIKVERRRIAAAKVAAERAARELAAAEAKALQDKQAAEAREARRKQMIGREVETWLKIGRLVESKLPKNYGEAIELLLDLREVATRTGQEWDFGSRWRAFQLLHSRKGSFLEKARHAGLEVSLG